jgi:hypothetical protein
MFPSKFLLRKSFPSMSVGMGMSIEFDIVGAIFIGERVILFGSVFLVQERLLFLKLLEIMGSIIFSAPYGIARVLLGSFHN